MGGVGEARGDGVADEVLERGVGVAVGGGRLSYRQRPAWGVGAAGRKMRAADGVVARSGSGGTARRPRGGCDGGGTAPWDGGRGGGGRGEAAEKTAGRGGEVGVIEEKGAGGAHRVSEMIGPSVKERLAGGGSCGDFVASSDARKRPTRGRLAAVTSIGAVTARGDDNKAAPGGRPSRPGGERRVRGLPRVGDVSAVGPARTARSSVAPGLPAMRSPFVLPGGEEARLGGGEGLSSAAATAARSGWAARGVAEYGGGACGVGGPEEGAGEGDGAADTEPVASRDDAAGSRAVAVAVAMAAEKGSCNTGGGAGQPAAAESATRPSASGLTDAAAAASNAWAVTSATAAGLVSGTTNPIGSRCSGGAGEVGAGPVAGRDVGATAVAGTTKVSPAAREGLACGTPAPAASRGPRGRVPTRADVATAMPRRPSGPPTPELAPRKLSLAGSSVATRGWKTGGRAVRARGEFDVPASDG